MPITRSSTVYTSDNTISLQECMQRCVHNIKEWYDKNQLVINTSKSNCMIVTTMQRDILTNVPGIEIFLGDDCLTQLRCLDYLGVKLDSYLTWNVQVDAVCKKLIFISYSLSRLKHVLASHILMYFYHSRLSFNENRLCNYNIGYSSQQYINKVQRLQNRAARILTGNYDQRC